MGRLAIELEKILKSCRDKGVPESICQSIVAIYKKAYKEGYHDGMTDCEEAQEKDEDYELY